MPYTPDKTISRNAPVFNCSEITASVGLDFFRKLNRFLSDTLSADCVYVAEKQRYHGRDRFQVLAAFRDGVPAADHSYDAAGTPCLEAVRAGQREYPGNFQQFFPETIPLLAEITSCVARRLRDSNGQPLGVLVLGWREAECDLQHSRQVLSKIDIRASAEMERIHTMRLLEEQLHVTQKILDAIPIPVFYKDSQFKYLGCNREFEKAIGCSREELIGKTVKEVAPGDCFARYAAVDQQVFTDGMPRSYEGPMVYSDGKEREVVFNKGVLTDSQQRHCGIVGTMFDVTELKKAEMAAYRLANFDPSTGLPNRQYFMQSLDKAVRHSRRVDRKVAVLCLDLDNFKGLCSVVGYDVCSQLMMDISERILRHTRERDTCAVIGTDRFAVVLPSIENEREAELVARRILGSLAEPILVDGHEFHRTGSIGIAVCPDDGTDAATLLQRAETAMTRARNHGGNTFLHSSNELNQQSLQQLTIEAGLRRSLAEGGFELHYQPQVDLQTGTLLGAEALLRWRHATLGSVSPERFIPIAEESGLIIPIGEWVLATACRQNVAWQKAGLPQIRMAVNISGHQLRQCGFPDMVERVLETTGLEPQWLEFELTESTLMDRSDENVAILLQLKEMGINLSIDDFGTGYSSLGYLQSFPLDKLKIDRSFIKDVQNTDRNAAITETIIAMAKRLGLSVVAEGVETMEQLKFLIANDCSKGQGYLFGRPVPGRDFENNVLRRDKRVRWQKVAVMEDIRDLSWQERATSTFL